jgi:hypothetical protein
MLNFCSRGVRLPQGSDFISDAEYDFKRNKDNGILSGRLAAAFPFKTAA